VAKRLAKKKSPTKTQPEPAQIKAIERLMENEDYAEAVRRIRALLARFPDHGGLHRTLVGALEAVEDHQAAALAAHTWAECRPNSLPAQEALLHFASARGHLMLGERIAAQVRALGGETPGYPLDPELKAAMLSDTDGQRVSAEVMERFDIGKLHLEGRDFAGALRWLEDLDVPPARNNAALAHFHLGQIDQALEAFLANWRRYPDNLFALGQAARLRLYRGDGDGARDLGATLAAAQAGRPEDALVQVETLVFLGEDRPAWDAFERAVASEWFALGDGPTRSRLRHFGACAAARLGRSDEATRWWQAARAADRNYQLPASNLDAGVRTGEAPPFPAVMEIHEALPFTWITAARTSKADEDSVALVDGLSASNAYLKALYLASEESTRKLVGLALRRRAGGGDATAAGLLRELARLPAGTADERFGFLTFLQTIGLIGRAETVTWWDGEALHEVRVFGSEIHREPAESDLPPDLLDLLDEGVEHFNQGRLDKTEACLQAILTRVPDHPVTLGNLAALRSRQGRDGEATALLRAVVAKHPDYLFARCNLANGLIFEGKLEEAAELLKGLGDRERLHVQHAFALYGAHALLHHARGEKEAAERILRSLEAMVAEPEDARRMAQIRRSLERLASAGTAASGKR
jgi:tetratricopeptide (TPR) repeat protein